MLRLDGRRDCLACSLLRSYLLSAPMAAASSLPVNLSSALSVFAAYTPRRKLSIDTLLMFTPVSGMVKSTFPSLHPVYTQQGKRLRPNYLKTFPGGRKIVFKAQDERLPVVGGVDLFAVRTGYGVPDARFARLHRKRRLAVVQ